MDQLYKNVAYAGIDTDSEFRYPKGAGRVVFSDRDSYFAAISTRFVQLRIPGVGGEMDKRVSITSAYLLMF